LEGWLLASSLAAPGDGFDQALAQAERELARDDDARSLALVAAEVLPGPAADQGRADRVAALVLARAIERLGAGEAAWLAPVLQLSAGSSSQAGAATSELVGRAGAGDCGRLPAPGASLPAPAGSLTVALRVLAATGVRCPAAQAVLQAALADPAWDTWVASTELADLAEVGGPLPAPVRRDLAARLRGFLVVDADHPIDLVAVTQVQAARRRLGLPLTLETPLARHLAGQVAHRGGLAGRSSSAPTAFDVAILRQLAGEALVPRAVVDATAASGGEASVLGPADPVVRTLLAGNGRLSCRDAPAAPARRARVSFDGLVADQAWATVRARCDGALDLADTVRRLRTGPHAEQRVVRIAAAELAACRMDPALVAAAPPLRVAVTGPFATDSTVAWARSVAADPVAACAALAER
jgi:hypothetical protein